MQAPVSDRDGRLFQDSLLHYLVWRSARRIHWRGSSQCRPLALADLFILVHMSELTNCARVICCRSSTSRPTRCR